jgi:hypothetical protein
VTAGRPRRSGAAAGGARFWGARDASETGARFARRQTRNRQTPSRSKEGLIERNAQSDLEILAPLRRAIGCERRLEEFTEAVASGRGSSWGPEIETFEMQGRCLSERLTFNHAPVVGGAPGRIAQDLERASDQRKHLRRFGVARMKIRMKLSGPPLKSAAQGGALSGRPNAENLVEVSHLRSEPKSIK